MIQIEGPQTSQAVEEELKLLRNNQDGQLQLPLRPKKWWLGGEAGLVLLVIAWSRSTKCPILVTHIQSGEEPAVQLRSMARRLFGFIALVMSSEIVDIQDGVLLRRENPGKIARSLRPSAYYECRNVVEMMFRPVSDFSLGAKVYLVCVDHSSLWAIPWFYSSEREVLDRIAFVSLASEIIEKVTVRAGVDTIKKTYVRDIGLIIHELFKNTHDWARKDETGSPWRRSVRGVTIERHSWSSSNYEEVSSGSVALKNYLKSLGVVDSVDNERFLEITVFDSGLGLARHLLGQRWSEDTSLQDEYAACKECLTKHRTSSQKSERGLGLAEVMTTVGALRGMMRIRTGRLSMYRDFANDPLQNSDDVELFDFVTTSKEMTEMVSVAGTHYQILIPLLREGSR